LLVSFSIGDAEQHPRALMVSAASGNQTLVPNANLTLGGTGMARQLTATPVAGQTGSAGLDGRAEFMKLETYWNEAKRAKNKGGLIWISPAFASGAVAWIAPQPN
jgi:hypothetical protein